MTSAVEPEPLTTLADFLLARIAEDWEDASRQAFPKRPLAECEAKRRIVVAAKQAARTPGDRFEVWWEALQLIALPHADHPDYSPNWRP